MNKTLKKTLSIILTVLMIVTTVPFAFAADIVDSGECGADGDNLTWTLDADGTLTISGEGAMADYHLSTLPPWAGYKENIKEIVIEEGVTELGRFAFYGHTAVKDVSIANSVTTFTGREFHGCSAIEKLIIPAGVSILSSTSFRECSSLKQIVFLGKVDIDNFYAFDGCSELREIVFAKGATNSEDVSYPFTINDINADEIVIHFGGTQAEADEAFAPISEMDKIYSVATIHYMDGCNCSDCDFVLAHSGGTATCIDLAVCQVCETVYGEVDADAHDWSNKDGVCANACGFECPHENYTDSKCDVCGYECPHENYTDDICDNCGAQKADYSKYFDALDRYYALTDEYADILVDKTGDYIKGKVQELVDEYLGDEEISGNFSVEKQYIIDGIADGVNEICDTIEKGIADGTLIIPDYTEIDEAIKSIDEALENATISDEMAAELADIKAQLEALKEDINTSKADLETNGLLDRVETITETMNNCADGNHTDEDGDYKCDNGCGYEFEKPVTPDEPADETCDRCGEVHTNFFQNFICMIIAFFNRIISFFTGLFK